MTDLERLDLTQLGSLVESKQVSPVEITKSCLEKIAIANPTLTAFVTVDEEGALRTAENAEQDIMAGNYRGPLHGLPVAHKDLYATKNLLTTGGSQVLKDWIPEDNATVVQRLADAGMICLGKTNTHEFAYGPTNEVSLFGAVRNPWDTSRISGGSSGGAGAAVAAGLIPIGTGSDTGGSIRIPSACCGVTGLKPTYGLLSRAGILPLCWTMDHPGPLARSARDIALFINATQGPDPRDPSVTTSTHPSLTIQNNKDLSGLRIGIPRRYFYDRAQTEVTDVVENVLALMEELGATLVDIDIEHIESSEAAATAIYFGEASAYHEDSMTENPELFHPSVRRSLEYGDQLLAKDYLHAQRFRKLLGQNMVKEFANVDVFAMPTTPITATPIGADSVSINGTEDGVFVSLLRNTEPFNLTGLPAIAAPCGFAKDNMPVSLQLVAPAFHENRLINAINVIQQHTDWHLKQPLLDV